MFNSKTAVLVGTILAMGACKQRSFNDAGGVKSAEPSAAWFNGSYVHENGGIFLTLNISKESSLQFAGRSPWGFTGELHLEGTARMSGVLREKAVEGNTPCWEFSVSSWNDGEAYPDGMVRVSMEWPKDITPSMMRSCAARPDFAFVRDVVPGMYKIDK